MNYCCNMNSRCLYCGNVYLLILFKGNMKDVNKVGVNTKPVPVELGGKFKIVYKNKDVYHLMRYISQKNYFNNDFKGLTTVLPILSVAFWLEAQTFCNYYNIKLMTHLISMY